MNKFYFVKIMVLFGLVFNCTFAHADIVLKLIGANPSKEQKQTIVLKAYLPKEVTLDDLIDADGLKLIYDTKESSYYVFGEQDLEPGEVVEKKIKIKDIWRIDEAELKSVRDEAQTTLEHLSNSEFKDRASFLAESITKRLDEIVENQNKDYMNPQNHISIYRSNMRKFDSVKDDLQIIRSLSTQIKRLPSVHIVKLIFIIIAFLSLLSIGLYFVWHKQASELT